MFTRLILRLGISSAKCLAKILKYMVAQSWTEILLTSLQGVWIGVINFLPSFIGAFILIIVGLIIAAGLRALVERIINA